MAHEIERKFLVESEAWRTGTAGENIAQGYLSSVPQRTVRVRIKSEKGYLTIKGPTTGLTRAEFEYEIPTDDARHLLTLCERPPIEKTRHRVEHAGRVWEIDEFHGENEGLIVAEVEVESEDAMVALPPWVGEEVSHDPRYYNSNLMNNPFRSWPCNAGLNVRA